MRHRAVIELTDKMTIGSQLELIDSLKKNNGITVTDISSEIDNLFMSVYFDVVGNIDTGRLQLDEDKVVISIDMSFKKLKELHSAIEVIFGESVKDIVDDNTDDPNADESGNQPSA